MVKPGVRTTPHPSAGGLYLMVLGEADRESGYGVYPTSSTPGLPEQGQPPERSSGPAKPDGARSN